jgi:hypothetical protein
VSGTAGDVCCRSLSEARYEQHRSKPHVGEFPVDLSVCLCVCACGPWSACVWQASVGAAVDGADTDDGGDEINRLCLCSARLLGIVFGRTACPGRRYCCAWLLCTLSVCACVWCVSVCVCGPAMYFWQETQELWREGVRRSTAKLSLLILCGRVLDLHRHT